VAFSGAAATTELMSEFLLGALLSITSLTATFALLKTEWNRVRCAYITFEATHSRMIGASPAPSLRVRVQTGPGGVRGVGVCGEAHEKVELPWLEEPR
jgi:hypothetical protein